MIHLVNMPFADIVSPSLALGLLQAELEGEGFNAHVHNFNLSLSGDMGFKPYRRLALSNVPLSEWLFTPNVWDETPSLTTPEELLEQYGFSVPQTPEWIAQREQLDTWRETLIPQFLSNCYDTIKAQGELGVVAFSCTFFQTLPALALGKRIKALSPQTKVVYGGASFHDEVGEELLRACDWMDAVCTGEAEGIIGPLFEQLLAHEVTDELRGVQMRNQRGEIVSGPAPGPATDEAFAVANRPTFDEFFNHAHKLGLTQDPGWRREAVVPFEASRGCWWGEKAHCTFCGLNGAGMSYRTKPENEVRDSMAYYLERYPVRKLHAADNLIAMQAFRDFLPALKSAPMAGDTEIFFHVKSNFNRRQLELLRDAGVTDVGPGIESLNSHLLELMRKGVSALQNVYFLKLCRELELKPRWTNLIRVPGEVEDDYREMAAWIPKVLHLSPPSGAGEIQLHRFSPYFFERERWVTDLRPHGSYRALYPEDLVDLSKVAYVFDGEWKDCLPTEARQDVVTLTNAWRQRWMASGGPPALEGVLKGDGLEVTDTRGGTETRRLLSAEDTNLLLCMDAPATVKKMAQALELSPELVSTKLATLEADGLVLEERGRWLSLVVVRDQFGAPEISDETQAIVAKLLA